MVIKPNRDISAEILDLIEWIENNKNNSEYEKGLVMGLRIAECIAEAIERNSGVSNDD